MIFMTGSTHITVRKMTSSDFSCWVEMRALLWPDCPTEKHIQEILEQLNSPLTMQAFKVEDQNEPIGFLEAAIHQHAHKQFVQAGYIEGWFVKDLYRMRGYGKILIDAAETWTVEMGYEQVASDTEDFNVGSIVAHGKLGYIEQFRADGEVKFLKSLC
jgi:aminoglycoside 6'-N-acetyltransferase I